MPDRDLEKLDCSCNDCKFMERDLKKFKRFDALYDKLHGGHKQSWRIHYGKCTNSGSRKFNKEVQFTPGICQLDTQQCFSHRRE